MHCGKREGRFGKCAAEAGGEEVGGGFERHLLIGFFNGGLGRVRLGIARFSFFGENCSAWPRAACNDVYALCVVGQLRTGGEFFLV